MKFSPDKCPECGADIKATCDLIPGNALVEKDEDGTYDYFGETKVCWDGQYNDSPLQDYVHVICENDHEFFVREEETGTTLMGPKGRYER